MGNGDVGTNNGVWVEAKVLVCVVWIWIKGEVKVVSA